jgi:cobalt/nickel transport system permease protein
MHVSDGIINIKITIIADIIAIPLVYFTGRDIKTSDIPKIGIFTAALFVISLIHFPLGTTSIHLCLFGLAGILFKKHSLPVIFTTLLFQSLIFQHGGLISLGINTLIMSSGALIAWSIWKLPFAHDKVRSLLAGFFSIVFPALLLSILFYLSGYGKGLLYLMSVYIPAAAIEAGLTITIISFLKKTDQELLN